MTESAEKDARHNERMARKKAVVDEKIAQATRQQGVFLVNTGNGKGKSSAGFGLIARAIGHGQKVGVVQFIKGRSDTGEEAFWRKQPEVQWHVMGEGFTWETQDRQRDVEKAQAAWEVARQMLKDESLGLLVFDELNIALKYGYLDAETVVADIKARPVMQHVVVTGRGAPELLVEAADTVTEMRLEKHAFKAGIQAMPGMEY